MQPKDLFDRLSDDQLVSLARHHNEKFNRAWKVVMSSHYRTGRYIDAKVDMDKEYKTVSQICDYAYNHRPWFVCDAVYEAANQGKV